MKKNRKDKKELLKGIREEYVNLIVADPFLPRELVPSNWAFAELTSVLRKVATG